MKLKIESLKVKNFKCFDNKKFYEFKFTKNNDIILLTGPNGFGKTTFFDAIELIFKNSITRLTRVTDRKSTKEINNILLNQSGEFGYLVLKLVDNELDIIKNIICKIDKKINNLEVEKSLEFYVFNGKIEKNLDEFIDNIVEWEKDIALEREINYIKENFNLFYYVSQAESTHFLKNTINDRKDTLDFLLNLDEIKNKCENIKKYLIGGSKSAQNVLVNQEITKVEDKIEEKVKVLKEKTKLLIDSDNKDVKYIQLLKYNTINQIEKWDLEKLEEYGELSVNLYSKIEKEIDALISLYRNRDNIKIYIENQAIEKLWKKEGILKKYVEYKKYIKENSINEKLIEKEICKSQDIVDLYNSSSFFRNSFEIKSYSTKDLINIKNILKEKVNFKISDVDNIINKINSNLKDLDIRTKKMKEIKDARERLREIMSEDEENSNCPYCNQEYATASVLNDAYDLVTEEISKFNNSISKNIDYDIKFMTDMLIDDKKIILDILGDINEKSIAKIQEHIMKLKILKESEEEKINIIEINKYIGEEKLSEFVDKEQSLIEIRNILTNKLQKYSSESFIDELGKYKLINLYKEKINLINLEQENLLNDKTIIEKKEYIRYQIMYKTDSEILNLRKELKELISKREKWIKVRENCDKIVKNHNKVMAEYKNGIMKNLRIPLLIYTAKLLQEIQSGLGVFVLNDNMSFVTNGDSESDILNTFSSGQLAGFILAFLISMNKQYVSDKDDNIGFILIDDPIQTMDDINIASFIEVLRNDFAGKQIIISTHEPDKENYILYKFLKYNLKGESINVKEKLYDTTF